VSGGAAYRSNDAGGSWVELPKPAGASASLEWNQLTAAEPGVLLGATSHGLIRSTDEGQSWAFAAGELGQVTVNGVLTHPARPGQAFAAQFDRIFFSSDKGSHWTPLLASGLERAAIRALAILRDEPGRLYALVAGRGVFSINLE
jgi:photosystem II stability/assembly factor-like uncharacterized protein